jgi:uncharacterized integral membrane protein
MRDGEATVDSRRRRNMWLAWVGGALLYLAFFAFLAYKFDISIGAPIGAGLGVAIGALIRKRRSARTSSDR